MDKSQGQYFHLQIQPINSGFVLVFKCKELILFDLLMLHLSLLSFSFHPSLANASGLIDSHILDILTQLIAHGARGFVDLHIHVEPSKALLDPDFILKGFAFGIDTDTFEIKPSTYNPPIWSSL